MLLNHSTDYSEKDVCNCAWTSLLRINLKYFNKVNICRIQGVSAALPVSIKSA